MWRGLLRRLAILLAAGVVALGAPVTGQLTPVAAANAACPSAASSTATSCTFALTGGEQTFTVPPSLTTVHVVARGASGGTSRGAVPGGRGALVTGDLGVTPGQTLYIEVGGAATTTGSCNTGSVCIGGFNGGGSSQNGGGGGGASDVRTVSAANSGTLDSRLLVAAGGGGGEGLLCDGTESGGVGTGGVAGSNGGTGQNCNGVAGGAGGLAGSAGLGTGANGGGGEGGGGGGGLHGGGGGGGVNSAVGPDLTGAGGGGGGSNYPASGTPAWDTTGTPSVTISYALPDTTPPTIAAHPDVTVEETGPSGAAVTYDSPTTTDPDDPNGVATCTPASGSTFALGATTVTCTASDAASNAATPTTFQVNVRDTTPPVLSVPAPIVAEATGPSGAVVTYPAATAPDLVGLAATICDHASGSTFALGSTTVTCTATDTSGNTATATFIVTVVDTTPPVLTVPAPIKTTATSAAGAVVSYPAATAKDLVDGSVTPTCSPASGSTFSLGTTTVTCSATDAHGNSTSGSFKVTVTYLWSGFAQPINDPAAGATPMSVFKAGSTVPVKFQLKDASGTVVQAGSLPTFSVSTPQKCADGAVDESTSTATPDTSNTYRWDSTNQQYIYNYKTASSLSGYCQFIQATLDDGTTQSVYVGYR